MTNELSIREDEILQLLASGRSTKQIASELSISENTVNWHVSHVVAKLGASTRAEAVAMRLRHDPPRWQPRAAGLGAALLIVLIGCAPLSTSLRVTFSASPPSSTSPVMPPLPSLPPLP